MNLKQKIIDLLFNRGHHETNTMTEQEIMDLLKQDL